MTGTERKRTFNEDAVLNLAGQALGVTPDRLRELAQRDVLIDFVDGTRIRVHYGKPGLGVWAIMVEKQGTAPQILTECSERTEAALEARGYEICR